MMKKAFQVNIDELPHVNRLWENENLPSLSPEWQQYLSYYGFDQITGIHRIGKLKTFHSQIFVHSINPGPKKITVTKPFVIVLHGYLDHSGTVMNLLTDLVNHGFPVICFDLPNHGLSQSKPTQTFREYATVLQKILDELVGDRPYVLTGHSTGAASILQWLTDYGLSNERLPGNMIFLAPLIKVAKFDLIRLGMIGYHLLGGALKSVPRVFQNVSNDKEFLKNQKTDPLQTRRIPVDWVRHYLAWYHSMNSYPKCYLPVSVIQGTRDTVVNAKYNLSWISRFFPNASIKVIPGAKHQLINEIPEIRNEVLRICNLAIEQK